MFVAVSFILYGPMLEYGCSGKSVVVVKPSPKSHFRELYRSDLLMSLILYGSSQFFTTRNSTYGSLTVMVFVAVDVHPPFFAVNVTVYVPGFS